MHQVVCVTVLCSTVHPASSYVKIHFSELLCGHPAPLHPPVTQHSTVRMTACQQFAHRVAVTQMAASSPSPQQCVSASRSMDLHEGLFDIYTRKQHYNYLMPMHQGQLSRTAVTCIPNPQGLLAVSFPVCLPTCGIVQLSPSASNGCEITCGCEMICAVLIGIWPPPGCP